MPPVRLSCLLQPRQSKGRAQNSDLCRLSGSDEVWGFVQRPLVYILSPVFQIEAYAAKLKELEALFSDTDGGFKPSNRAEVEAALRATEELVTELQDNTGQLAGRSSSGSPELQTPFTLNRTQSDRMTPSVSDRAGEEAAGPSVHHQQEPAGRGAGHPEHRGHS